MQLNKINAAHLLNGSNTHAHTHITQNNRQSLCFGDFRETNNNRTEEKIHRCKRKGKAAQTHTHAAKKEREKDVYTQLHTQSLHGHMQTHETEPPESRREWRRGEATDITRGKMMADKLSCDY